MRAQWTFSDGVMTREFEYHTRPNGVALSIAAFAGLTLLAASLWNSFPGFVILLLVPALAVCFWQIVVIPTYGMRLSQSTWDIIDGPNDRSIAVKTIAYLRVSESEGPMRCSLMLNDGTELDLNALTIPAPMVLIREATKRGIPVRQS